MRGPKPVTKGERGEGRLGTVIALCLLAVVVYLGFKVVPVMVNAYAFRDFIEQEARFAAIHDKDDEVKKRVVRKAKELSLPVNHKNVKIKRTRTHCDIEVKYTIPIETPVYTYNWSLDESSRAPLF